MDCNNLIKWMTELNPSFFTSSMGACIGEHVGSGADADVYGFGHDRVIKFTSTSIEFWPEVSRVLQRFQDSPSPAVVKVFDAGEVARTRHIVYYYAIYERLIPIAVEDEAESVCNAISSVWNNHDHEVVNENERALIRELKELPFSYDDIHCDNVMKTTTGDYKVIDVESFQYKV